MRRNQHASNNHPIELGGFRSPSRRRNHTDTASLLDLRPAYIELAKGRCRKAGSTGIEDAVRRGAHYALQKDCEPVKELCMSIVMGFV
jgi:hypothetical protein